MKPLLVWEKNLWLSGASEGDKSRHTRSRPAVLVLRENLVAVPPGNLVPGTIEVAPRILVDHAEGKPLNLLPMATEGGDPGDPARQDTPHHWRILGHVPGSVTE